MVADEAKSHIPSARETANWVPFHPGMQSGLTRDERIEELRRRVKARQSVVRQEDHPPVDHVEYVPDKELTANSRVSRVVTKLTALPELPKNLGTRIRLLRKRFGWSIRKLALKASMDHAGLIRIEASQCSPSVATTTALCRALGVPLAYLVGGLEE